MSPVTPVFMKNYGRKPSNTVFKGVRLGPPWPADDAADTSRGCGAPGSHLRARPTEFMPLLGSIGLLLLLTDVPPAVGVGAVIIYGVGEQIPRRGH